MKIFLKNLLLYKKAFFIIVFFLLIQAYCDLKLPQYTSNIIDVGIMNQGVEHILPRQMTEADYTYTLAYMTESEKDVFRSYYIEENGIYRLVASKRVWDKADQIFQEPFVKAYLSKENMDMVDRVDLGTELTRTMGITYAIECNKAAGVDMHKLQTSYMWRIGIKMIFVAFLMLCAAIAVGYFSSRVGAMVGRDLRKNIFGTVLKFSNTEMEQFSTASLITRSTNDIQQIQMVTVIFLRIILYAPIIGLGGVFKVIQTGANMVWVIVLAVIAILCLVITLVFIAMPKFKKMQHLIDRMNLVSREILTGLSVVRAFSREKKEEERFEIANHNLTKTQLFTNRIMAFMMPGMMMIMYGITLLIVWVSARNIDNGTMQVGTMTAFITYTIQIVISFLMLTIMSIMFPRAAVASERIHEVIHTQSSIINKDEAIELKNPSGHIKFSNVSFRYPDAKEMAICNITFEANQGEVTAIIGSTGSGKSTIINLIPRFYDVSEGEILIDGVDIRKYSLKSLRNAIGFVPQKGLLFSGSIASNIKFGQKSATTKQMSEAAEIAQAKDFILKKEDGFDSTIAQGGSNVSGGQKQRISIARAIMKEPKIYIFDDSFSALDVKTERKLRDALLQKTQNATVLIVAQRISTIMSADKIIVLEDGRIVGEGTHFELLKNCQVYKQIAYSQLSPDELGVQEACNE